MKLKSTLKKALAYLNLKEHDIDFDYCQYNPWENRMELLKIVGIQNKKGKWVKYEKTKGNG